MIKQILLGAVLCGYALAAVAGEPKPQPKVGEVPPPMLGRLHGSDTLVDLANYRGKVVIYRSSSPRS